MDTLTDYLEGSHDYTHSFGDNEIRTTIPISRHGDAAITLDERAYDLIEGEFGPYDEDFWLTKKDVQGYFEGRPEVGFNYWVEKEGIETDESGNPIFSDIFERRAGNCAMESITVHVMTNETVDRYESHFVNGQTIDNDNMVSPHAFVILENKEDGEDILIDPDLTINTEDGDFMFRGHIQDLEDDKIILGERGKRITDDLGYKYFI